MSRPTYEPRISLGNLLTLASMAIVAALMWGEMNARIDAGVINQDRQERDLRDVQARLRSVETLGSRQGAQLDLILATLAEIKATLDRRVK